MIVDCPLQRFSNPHAGPRRLRESQALPSVSFDFSNELCSWHRLSPDNASPCGFIAAAPLTAGHRRRRGCGHLLARERPAEARGPPMRRRAPSRGSISIF